MPQAQQTLESAAKELRHAARTAAGGSSVHLDQIHVRLEAFMSALTRDMSLLKQEVTALRSELTQMKQAR